jgi:hypothetical protein
MVFVPLHGAEAPFNTKRTKVRRTRRQILFFVILVSLVIVV